jgi:serine/threonine protein phosphatase PrpC
MPKKKQQDMYISQKNRLANTIICDGLAGRKATKIKRHASLLSY